MIALHPDVAAKAQREIDSVIGTDPERLPTLGDRQSLPYLDCLLKELYRSVRQNFTFVLPLHCFDLMRNR